MLFVYLFLFFYFLKTFIIICIYFIHVKTGLESVIIWNRRSLIFRLSWICFRFSVTVNMITYREFPSGTQRYRVWGENWPGRWRWSSSLLHLTVFINLLHHYMRENRWVKVCEGGWAHLWSNEYIHDNWTEMKCIWVHVNK